MVMPLDHGLWMRCGGSNSLDAMSKMARPTMTMMTDMDDTTAIRIMEISVSIPERIIKTTSTIMTILTTIQNIIN